jgi:hypothetical protein
MIVEISLCCIGNIMGRQNTVNEFFGSRFSIAASNSYKGNIKLKAVVLC